MKFTSGCDLRAAAVCDTVMGGAGGGEVKKNFFLRNAKTLKTKLRQLMDVRDNVTFKCITGVCGTFSK